MFSHTHAYTTEALVEPSAWKQNLPQFLSAQGAIALLYSEWFAHIDRRDRSRILH